jgi:DNA-directed RNA polymerase specialized sigma24 family protein
MMLVELELLYRERLADFCRAAAAIAGDAELGRDAVQEAFARAVRKRRRYRGSGTIEAWVWRIVVNASHDARPTRPLLADPGDAPMVDSPIQRRLPLELLTERQREVLFLHYYADLDYATIAAALGISAGTVGATLSTARQTLRQALTKEVAP